MKQKQNNYAFIDSQNLNLGVLTQNWKLDFARFRKHLHDKFQITKAFLFIGYVKGNESLYTYLQNAGYICIFKPTLEIPDKFVKGNVDAELVLHTMINVDKCDSVMIVSGDGDFHCLVEYLIEQNKLLALYIPNQRHYSALLKRKDFSKYVRFVSDVRNKVEKKERPH